MTPRLAPPLGSMRFPVKHLDPPGVARLVGIPLKSCDNSRRNEHGLGPMAFFKGWNIFETVSHTFHNDPRISVTDVQTGVSRLEEQIVSFRPTS